MMTETTPLVLREYAIRGLPLFDVPVFDAHAHIGGLANHPALSLPDHVAMMDRVGIDVTAVSSCLALNGAIRDGNNNVAAACEQFPDRFVGYCHVSGNYPELMTSELNRCFAMDCFRAIKLYQVGCAFDDPAFLPVWECAKDRRLPVMSHTWGGNLTELDTIAERFPSVPFILAHSGSALAHDKYIEAAQRCPNIYLDLTYSREHTNQIEHMTRAIGPERVVWGTDVPCFSMGHQLGKLLLSDLTDAEKRLILYDNAARLFGVDVGNG